MHHYTPEELVLFLYKETTAEQTAAIEEDLAKDWSLREKMAVLKTAMERLDSIVEAPRTEPVLNILKYAAQTQKVPS